MTNFVLQFLLVAASLRAEEPSRLHRSLYEAASAGDVPKFEAALEHTRAYVETMPLGEARNKLRRAVVVATDLVRIMRFEAIYWDEDALPDFYDRLANEYGDFEKFIAPHRLIDRTGRVLYPTRETRAFLLNRLRPNSPRRST